MTTDLVPYTRPEVLARVRRTFPDAVAYGQHVGARFQVEAELRKRQRRGEIIPIWRFTRRLTPGVIRVPFVVIKTPEQMRARTLRHLGLIGSGAILSAGLIGWLIWTSRYVIGALGMVALMFGIYSRFGRHWKRGCSGLHCASCTFKG